MEPSFFLTRTIGAAHGLVEGCTTPCCNMSSTCWCAVPCWCIGSLLGVCLIGGWSPVLIRCCTIPVRPRSDGPNEKMSVNSSKRLASPFLCERLRFMASRLNCSEANGFVCLCFLVASPLQLATLLVLNFAGT